MTERPIQHAEDCLGRNTYYAAVRFADGTVRPVRYCPDCEKRSDFLGNREALALGIRTEDLEVIRDNAAGAEPCEVCASTAGTQLHHFLPTALEDHVSTSSNAWPTAYLCRGCHSEWHRAVTPDLVAHAVTMHQLGARRSTTVRELADMVRAYLVGKRGAA